MKHGATEGKYYQLQKNGTHTLFEYANGRKGYKISKHHMIAQRKSNVPYIILKF